MLLPTNPLHLFLPDLSVPNNVHGCVLVVVFYGEILDEEGDGEGGGGDEVDGVGVEGLAFVFELLGDHEGEGGELGDGEEGEEDLFGGGVEDEGLFGGEVLFEGLGGDEGEQGGEEVAQGAAGGGGGGGGGDWGGQGEGEHGVGVILYYKDGKF